MRQLLRSVKCFLPCFTLFLAVLNTLASPAETWREIDSPHFQIVTDSSERDGRDVANHFEQMRAVLAARFNNPALETGAPLLIFAVHESGSHALAPDLWKKNQNIAGLYLSGWERQYAMVRLDSFGGSKQSVVFHEYAHSVLHANVHWLPTWLDKGMAEFYAYTRFESGHVLVGNPSVRLVRLKNEALIPIPQMLTANGGTFAKDPEKDDLFYAEAWMMVHYMTFGPGMDGGGKINQFLTTLESGTPQSQAFEQIFGDPTVFQNSLLQYSSRFTMSVGVLPPIAELDAKSFSAKVLTAAEVNYSLGSFDVGAGDLASARARFLAAESEDPTLPGPHEELGFLDWREGKDNEAHKDWQKAVAADSARYRSAFALLMTGIPIKQQTEQQLVETQRALEVIKDKAPKFAPIYVELALIQWRFKHFNQAYRYSLAAERLEPWRAGYHLLSGYILLQGNQARIAEGNARMVANRWTGSDHNEAVDLLNLIPADAHDQQAVPKLSMPSSTSVVRGTIVSSVCDQHSFTLVLQPSAPKSAPLSLVSDGLFESGFSDTLWVGRDHFTPCFHLEGLPALVAYKRGSAATETLVTLEVRDDLPEVVLPEVAPKTAESTKPAGR